MEDPTEVDQATVARADSRARVTLTAREALDAASTARVRRVQVLSIAMSIVVAAGLVAHGLDEGRLWVPMGGLAIGIVTSAAVLVYLRDRPLPDRPLIVLAFCLPGSVASYTAFTYFGFFSFGQGMLALALYGISVGAPKNLALANYFSIALVPAIGTFGIALGLLPEAGRIRAAGDTGELLVAAASIQLMYLGSYLLASHATRVSEKAVRDLEEAHRAVAQRDAVLDEVREDIARVMQGAGPASGKILGGWKLGAVIGRGGMGEVYEARAVSGDRVAAVKLLGAVSDDELAARFRREGEAMARLDHPNVVKLLDVGDGFIVMERLRGEDLGAILRDTPQLPAADVVVLVTQVARALEAARLADVVHRDLKPHNLFRTAETRTWKVLDFGISKLGASTTLTQGVIGTPAYMAPEHIDGTPVTHVTDVFSLGLVTYRAVTGRPAFSGEHAKILGDVLGVMPAQPSSVAALDEDVDLAIALAIAKAPGDRLPTALAFAQAFEAATRGALEPRLRERARALVREHRWGQRK